MGPGRPLVHVRGSDGSAVPGNLDELIDLIGWRNVFFSDVFDEHSSLFIWTDLQVLFMMVKEISQLLHVEFSQGNLYSKFNVFIGFGDGIENMFDHSRNNSWLLGNGLSYLALHRVGFSRGCLTISKYCAVETFNNAVNDRRGWILVDLFLSGLSVKHFIKGKFERFFWISDFFIFDLNCFVIE